MRRHLYFVWLSVLALSFTACALAQMSVLNANYDQEQTGANLQETALQPNINWSNFGKVGTFAVDGQVYAQPLYMPGVTIAGKTYNVVYVVTMHNSVYAFNADTPQVSTPLWHVNLGPIVPNGLYNLSDITPEIGILGTPVIDPAKQILYVVANTLAPGAKGIPAFYLHALSLVDGHDVIKAIGHELVAAPVLVSGNVPGNGVGSTDGSLPFDAFWQLQRPGLMLSNKTLYVAFGSHADTGNYHGWLMSYDPATLRLKSIFNSTPNGKQSAIWHSGRAPSFDSKGDVYVATGNGDWDGQANFGESALHLSGADLALKDWYTPAEWSDLNDNDEDLGSAGVIVIPNTNLVLVGGKAGMLHLIQTSSMGHLGPDNSNTVQSVQVNGWGLFSMVLWPQTIPIVYEFDPDLGTVKAFQIVDNQINSTILSQYKAPVSGPYCGMSLSANGTQGGIVWLATGDTAEEGVPGTLHALDASNLSNELWNSDLAAGNRDTLGRFAKFAVPMVANGRVYVPTFSNTVEVYSVLGSSTPSGPGIISAVVNTASYLEGPVSPGELVTIFGANLGPVGQISAEVDGQRIPTTTGGSSVLFDGTAAPVLSTSSDQISTVVPFGAAGTSTQIQVLYQGNVVASAKVPVQAASPALFAQNGSGGGIGAILNQDGTLNSSSNGAAQGSQVSLFATGLGVTTPPSQDGVIAAPPYPAIDLPVSVTIEGEPAKVVYAGPAAGMVAGMMQIDIIVPANAFIAPWDPLVLTVGTYSSPDGVIISVVK
jgi:uncharacterized protein (TIGR03437 family)